MIAGSGLWTLFGGGGRYDPLMSHAAIAPSDELLTEVAQAAALKWRVAGHSCSVVTPSDLQQSLGLDRSASEWIAALVVLPDLNSIECVMGSWADQDSVAASMRLLIDRSIKVNAILPVGSLGAAHERLRGLSITVQGWWQEATGPKFTSAEVV